MLELMALYDSSALIEYLDGNDAIVEYISTHADERAITIPLVAFELYQGEVYRAGTTDLEGVESALQWLEVVETTGGAARHAAEVLGKLHDAGTPLAARDAFIAGAAAANGETLVATDTDFDIEALRQQIDLVVV
jgi:tRNA(fMet)-specific endonuclease VapC